MIILAGRAHTTAALAVWPHATTPLADASGIGHQLTILAGLAAAAQRLHAAESRSQSGQNVTERTVPYCNTGGSWRLPFE